MEDCFTHGYAFFVTDKLSSSNNSGTANRLLDLDIIFKLLFFIFTCGC